MEIPDAMDLREDGDKKAEGGQLYCRARRFLDEHADASDSPYGVQLLKQAADCGDARAQYDLAQLYLEGEGVPQSLAHASELLFDAARKGVVAAHVDLAAIHLYQPSSWHPRSAAYPHLVQAASLGNPMAALEIGKLELLAGHAESALEWLNLARRENIVPAKRWLAVAAWFGFGRSPDKDEASVLTLEAANAGDIGASYQYVWMGGPSGEVPEAEGTGSHADHVCCEAIYRDSLAGGVRDLAINLDAPMVDAIRETCGERGHWMRRALAAAYPPALAWVGERMCPRLLSLEVDQDLEDSDRDCIDLLTDAALKGGHPRAAWLLGRWYAAKKRGLEEAVRLLKIATKSDYADSRALITELFECHGAETPEILQSFAEAGITEAQFGHAMALYTKGESKGSFRWMRRAALGGHKGASRRLAFFYEMGEGCQKDQVLSARWREVFECGASVPEQEFAPDPPHFDISLWRSRGRTQKTPEDVPAGLSLGDFVANELETLGTAASVERPGQAVTSHVPVLDIPEHDIREASPERPGPLIADGLLGIPVLEIHGALDSPTCWLDAWRIIGPTASGRTTDAARSDISPAMTPVDPVP